MRVGTFHKAVLGFEGGLHFRHGRVVGVVAVDATFTQTGATAQIPVAVHASMGAVLEIAQTALVALAAELRDILEGNGFARRIAQSVVAFRIVTGQTRHVCMIESETLVEFIQIF